MNRLGSQKSPYLLQHATNPVDWYFWGDEAFAAARAQNKPVFLSIGYSTCHWCHVMAHESFADRAIAELMNRVFINVKVDREERPDIDAVYMTVCQALTGSGGWPLTIIMTPDKEPFFAGTYFPPDSRPGRIGMRELAELIDELWTSRKQELLNSAQQIAELLKKRLPPAAGSPSGVEQLTAAFEELSKDYDQRHGGFGPHPKFPTPQKMLYLLRHWKRFRAAEALAMVEKTLDRMRQGGIYDHLGFGFHRYSTDAQWLLPHFEKMLYDQAMIARVYLEAYQATGRQEYAKTAREIFTYVLRDLRSTEGGFFSAQDADSEGEEGRFYVWSSQDLSQVLTPPEAELWSRIYSVEPGGNFFDEAKKVKTGANIFHLRKPLDQWAEQLKLSPDKLGSMLEECRVKLYRARKKREHPFLDDKILTDWNGLMIASLAFGARVLDDREYESAAGAAADFILANLRDDRGKLWHCWREGEAAIPAFLDDYAFLIWGLIELYQTGFDPKYLLAAVELNDQLLAHFWDDREGGFFFTSEEHEELLFRNKSFYDGAIPSGNSVCMLNLISLARMTGETELERKAQLLGNAYALPFRQSPSAHAFYLTGLDYLLGPAYEIVIVGKKESPAVQEVNRALSRHFVPNKVVMLVPDGPEGQVIRKIAPFTASFPGEQGRASIYVCADKTCRKPTTDADELIAILTEG